MAAMLAGSLDRAVLQHYRGLAERRVAAVALALTLYRSDHNGDLPAKLQDLVPAYLPAVPTDPLAAGGKPIAYAVDGGRPRVYSVGPNGVDDGGLPEDPDAPRPRNRQASDLVVDLHRQPRPIPLPTDEDEESADDSLAP
jgi:hypothetical protein